MTVGVGSSLGTPVGSADVMGERGLLMGVTYRLLGSTADAEDAVQEAYLRWFRIGEDERRAISSPRAWLVTTASRIALDTLTSARARREQYVGEWLPEPVPSTRMWTSQGATSVDPAERAAQSDSVSMALLIVLESMTPAERVVFILHDVFRYTFTEIADVVERSPAACRQLASSARRRLGKAPRSSVDRAEHAAAVRAFATAWQSGELSALISVLDPNATAITDGGGIVSASLGPLHGAEVVAQFLVGVLERQPDLAVRSDLVNGEAGLVATDSAGQTLAVMTFLVNADGMIERLWAVRNPQKLAMWNPPATSRRTSDNVTSEFGRSV